ncbi:polyprenyl synthetase family protein [Streptomyces sp. Go40/10]|uniref:polyprenyl synthetase family protein n=1 Tax=Streptomyces sp. Go40/10 TaxID=2825844 RepID=UPI001E29D7C3|nr:polyprenyl synthetase family protein [Streptomyces sp. Go40/10]UFQ99957.1 polyprenyl synthetase family protein [Streptomyces sp. Go40/10]
MPSAGTSSPPPDPDLLRLAGDLSRVRDRVVEELTLDDPPIEDALQHLIRHPGKLLRPALVLGSAGLVGADPPVSEQVVTAGATVELLHLASLCHDDLCDRAEVRRGVPTVNARYGDDAALVVGDYLLASALGLAGALGPEAATAAARCARRICVGQLIELRETGDVGRTVPGYLAAVAGKTAELISFSARLGALAAGADESRQEALSAFGHHLGVAFQIWNDLGDLTAPGEDAGRDLGNGVYTLPVLYGLETAGDRLRPLLSASPRDRTVAEVVAVLRECGALDRAAGTAAGRLRSAFDRLEAAGLPRPTGVTALRRMLARLLPEVAELLDTPPRTTRPAEAAR